MQLNPYLQPIDAPVTQSNQVTGYDFILNNERGALISQSMFGTAVIGGVNIEDAAIGSAKIEDAAITTAKIGSAAVTNAKIDSIEADKITAGIISVLAQLGGSTGDNERIELDGSNTRIVLYEENSGTANPQIVITI